MSPTLPALEVEGHLLGFNPSICSPNPGLQELWDSIGEVLLQVAPSEKLWSWQLGMA